MGLFRRVLPYAFPMTRLSAALWAWSHRNEIKGWLGYAARSAPKIVGGDAADVVSEGRLRARLTSDRRTRDVDGLVVDVADGVATVRGSVEPSVHDAVVAVATNTSGVTRVRDELTDIGRWRADRR